MGIEIDLGCERCRIFAWLGSRKPEKWRGFQVGNRHVAEFLSLHTDPCRLVLLADTEDRDWDEGAPWREDLRSRSFWSLRTDRWRCGQCDAVLPGEQRAVSIGRHLAFCSRSCLQANLETPPSDGWVVSWPRTYRPARLRPRAPLWLTCAISGERRLACHGDSLELLDAEALAQWMIEHPTLSASWVPL